MIECSDKNSMEKKYNCVVLLGPTAAGKTSLGVRIADNFGWDIISGDSRQVYCGLDLGSGKDLSEYTVKKTDLNGNVYEKHIPYHLIDITTLSEEYNVFNFQRDFYALFDKFTAEGKMPFVVGGTGMYVDSIIRGYELVNTPENPVFRAELESKSLEELAVHLKKIKPNLHNVSDLANKERVIHAIEIQTYLLSDEYKAYKASHPDTRNVNAFVIGTAIPRPQLRENITKRLKERFDAGMIEEVKGLHDSGFSWERLEQLGLEYRYISLYLEGKIESFDALFERLNHAIHQFAKRQETWFRGMEKKGVTIHWLPPVLDGNSKYSAALELIRENVL